MPWVSIIARKYPLQYQYHRNNGYTRTVSHFRLSHLSINFELGPAGFLLTGLAKVLSASGTLVEP